MLEFDWHKLLRILTKTIVISSLYLTIDEQTKMHKSIVQQQITKSINIDSLLRLYILLYRQGIYTHFEEFETKME